MTRKRSSYNKNISSEQEDNSLLNEDNDSTPDDNSFTESNSALSDSVNTDNLKLENTEMISNPSLTELESDIPLINLHFVSSHRSKDGKSFFAKTVAHYCESQGKPIILVDCDRTNPDVSNVYKQAERVFFSENRETENEPDAILEWAMERNLPVLINLPGSVHELVTAWIDRTLVPIIVENASLRGDARPEVNVQIYNWYLCNGEQPSLNLFLESLNYFGGCVQHILVRNYGLSSNWKLVEDCEDLQRFCRSTVTHSQEPSSSNCDDAQVKDRHGLPIKKVLQIDLPSLSTQERNRLNREELTFAQTLVKPSSNGLTPEGYKAWPIWSRQRIVDFLKKASVALDSTQLWV
ncbi:MAG TPA: hypothetical protein V6D21_22460 [Candidatus Obscuribacterales bacterium]